MRYLLILIPVALLIFILNAQFPSVLEADGAKGEILYSSLLVAMLAGSALGARQITMTETLKYSLIWLGLLLAIVAGYSYRDVLLDSRLGAELMPSRVRTLSDGSLQLKMGEDGHFAAQSEVNGASVRFIVDTGATEIVLSPADAKRAGYDVDSLKYDRAYQTANGTGGGARIVIGSLKIGHMLIENQPASVNKEAMHDSLLGMSYLKHFRSYRVEGETLTLTP